MLVGKIEMIYQSGHEEGQCCRALRVLSSPVLTTNTQPQECVDDPIPRRVRRNIHV